MSAETMAWLADNYQLGIGVVSGVVILIYLIISVLSIRKFYSYRGVILLRCTIPIIHILFLIFGKGSSGDSKLGKTEKTVTSIDNQKQEDDLLKDIF